MYPSWAGVMETAPSNGVGQLNRPHDRQITQAVVPDGLEENASSPLQDEQIAAMRILIKLFLNEQREQIEAPARVGVADGDPHALVGEPGSSRFQDFAYLLQLAASTPAPTRLRRLCHRTGIFHGVRMISDRKYPTAAKPKLATQRVASAPRYSRLDCVPNSGAQSNTNKSAK